MQRICFYFFIRLCGLCCLCIVSTLGFAAEPKQSIQSMNQAIESTESQLSEQQSTIQHQQLAHEQAQQRLQATDQAIATTARRIRDTAQELTQTQKELQTLQKKKQEKLNIAKKQQQLLSGQVKSQYLMGQYHYGKMLLQQNEASKFERMVGYYQYINQARIQTIQTLQTILADLDQIESSLTTTNEQLSQDQHTQQQQRQQLVQLQTEQQQSIQQLSSTIKTEQSKLTQLQQQLGQLQNTLDNIRNNQVKTIALNGLRHVRGKLNWPTEGKLRHRFGRKRQGRLLWKGVTINSELSAPVNTIYDGQVVFADWLRGFGWVIVIDHGRGYMSLYGHNQTLLKSPGEKVEAGEPIALVGQSGGQSQAGLYFEIRHQGKAINPERFCRKS